MQQSSKGVHRIEFDLSAPPHTAYAYLVPGEEPVLVDAGTPGDEGWAELADGLNDAGYAPEDVDHLLITHPHTDHEGQVPELLDVADPTIYAPEGVRERLARDADELADVVRRNAAEVDAPDPEKAVEGAVDSLRRNRSYLPPDEIDEVVTFGDPFLAGGVTFEPIHTPGHQADQASFFADGALFAGDALAEPFRPAALYVGFDRGCYDCVDVFYEGLDGLAAYDVDRVYPGHGPVFDDAAGAIGRARADLDALLKECRRTLADLGRATPYEVTDARIDDSRLMRFSLFESIGAFARLVRRGEFESTVEDGTRSYRVAAPSDGSLDGVP
jgi:glyoxylase-like metal-dependent hydrolase (beta-lactamase superfamily II)